LTLIHKHQHAGTSLAGSINRQRWTITRFTSGRSVSTTRRPRSKRTFARGPQQRRAHRWIVFLPGNSSLQVPSTIRPFSPTIFPGLSTAPLGNQQRRDIVGTRVPAIRMSPPASLTPARLFSTIDVPRGQQDNYCRSAGTSRTRVGKCFFPTSSGVPESLVRPVGLFTSGFDWDSLGRLQIPSVGIGIESQAKPRRTRRRVGECVEQN